MAYGNTVKGYWRVYLNYSVNNNYSATQAAITFNYGINWVKDVAGDDDDKNYGMGKDRPTYVACTGQTTRNFYPSGTLTKTNSWAGRNVQYGSGTFYINKKTAAQTVTLTGYITHVPTKYTLYKGTSSVSVALSISALVPFSVAFNENTTDTVTNMPATATKYPGINIALPSEIPLRNAWEFQAWNTSQSGTGTSYAPGQTYTGNSATTLYARWTYIPSVIYNIDTFRVDSNLDIDDEGDYICVQFDYDSGHTPSGGYVASTAVAVSMDGNSLTLYSGTASFSGSGTKKKLYYSAPVLTYPTSDAYPIIITLSESGHDSVAINSSLASSVYPIEVAADGTSIAFGVSATMKQNLYLEVDEYAASGTVDAELHDAIDALGWWCPVIDGGVLED